MRRKILETSATNIGYPKDIPPPSPGKRVITVEEHMKIKTGTHVRDKDGR